MCSNPNLDLVNINAYTNFGKILSICAQDIEQQLNCDGWNDRRTTDNRNQEFVGYNKSGTFICKDKYFIFVLI